MKIGVISDTHGFFDPKVVELFAGVEHILHGGDIGKPTVILDLQKIAPITAVVGNNDPFLRYRETEIVTFEGCKLLLHHIVNPYAPAEELAQRIQRDQIDGVVFGHTHRPHNELNKGTLFLNPGYAGKTRFDMPRSVAILHCHAGEMRAEFFDL